MKIILVMLVALAVGVGVLYFRGGYATFNPDEQGRKAKSAIAPGMTLAAVVKVAEPKFWRPMMRETRNKLTVVKPGPENKFNINTLNTRIKNNELPDGFVIDYQFSASTAFRVVFDNGGIVDQVEDLATVNDLFNNNPGAIGRP
ncbi:MAG TPA: hypothetical protein VGM03_15165 [Phycisphaerae bacterium]